MQKARSSIRGRMTRKSEVIQLNKKRATRNLAPDGSLLPDCRPSGRNRVECMEQMGVTRQLEADKSIFELPIKPTPKLRSSYVDKRMPVYLVREPSLSL